MRLSEAELQGERNREPRECRYEHQDEDVEAWPREFRDRRGEQLRAILRVLVKCIGAMTSTGFPNKVDSRSHAPHVVEHSVRICRNRGEAAPQIRVEHRLRSRNVGKIAFFPLKRHGQRVPPHIAQSANEDDKERKAQAPPHRHIVDRISQVRHRKSVIDSRPLVDGSFARAEHWGI